MIGLSFLSAAIQAQSTLEYELGRQSAAVTSRTPSGEFSFLIIIL
jgi:hypothetical protein